MARAQLTSDIIACAFSSPEAALLLVSTKNRDLWPCPTPEVRNSRTSRHSAHVQSQVWQIWLVLVSIYCVFKAIQKRNVVGPGQRSRFLVLTKRSAASGNENVACVAWRFKQFEREHTKRRSREEPPARMTSIIILLPPPWQPDDRFCESCWHS